MERGPGIQDFLVECTLRVETDLGGGTGFFVAPGLVATCAHLIEDDRNGDYPLTRVKLTWRNRSYSASVVRYAASPEPNLAVLETDISDHPCAFLFGPHRRDDALYLCGYSSDEKVARLVLEGVENAGSGLILQSGPRDPSLSGAPLLNLRTGGVCAILNTSSPEALRAIPVWKLEHLFSDIQARHDHYHDETPQWFGCTGIVGTAFAARSHLTAMTATDGEPMQPLLASMTGASGLNLLSPARFRILAGKFDSVTTERFGTHELFRRCQQSGRSLLLVGQAGSGRSSLLRLFGHMAAASCKRLGAQNEDCLFPILLRASELALSEGSPEGSILNAIRTGGGRVSETPLPTQFLTDLTELPRLRLLIMLDGVDEIQNARDLADLVGLIGRLREDGGFGSKTQLLLTSRPSSAEHFRYSDFDICEILPLGPDSIEQSARQWLGEGRERFLDLNEDLFRSGLLSSPLVLSVALMLFERHGKKLSNQVIALYGALVNECVEAWKARKLGETYGSEILDNAVDLLGYLALELVRSATLLDKAWVAEKVEQYFAERMGFGAEESQQAAALFASFGETESLFLRKAGDRYYWSHRSFRDYLAASFLVRSAPDADVTIREIKSRWFDANWGKIPSFAIQMLPSAKDRLRIVNDILSSGRDFRLEFVTGLIRDGAVFPDEILNPLGKALLFKAKEEQSAYGIDLMPPNGRVFAFDLLLSIAHLAPMREALKEIAVEEFSNPAMRDAARHRLP